MKTRICQDTGCSKRRKRSVSKYSRLKNDEARRTRRRTRTRDGLRAVVLPRRVRSINGDTRNATRWKSEREQTTTHGSAITCRWRDISRQRPREVAPRDGRCMTTHIKKNQKISRRIIKKIVRKIGCRTCRVGHPVRAGPRTSRRPQQLLKRRDTRQLCGAANR